MGMLKNFIQNMRQAQEERDDRDDEETTDRYLRSLRRQRRTQMERVEKAQLIKEIKKFEQNLSTAAVLGKHETNDFLIKKKKIEGKILRQKQFMLENKKRKKAPNRKGSKFNLKGKGML